MHASLVWALWQGLILQVATSFTEPGKRRLVEGVTGLARNVEEHTITQSLVGLGRPDDWKALETFAEQGAWHLPWLERSTARVIGQLPEARGYGYRVWAGDDTKVHRSRPGVWGSCTFHEYTARCPNRASTVRAPNGVVLGALRPQTDEPAVFLPVRGRL